MTEKAVESPIEELAWAGPNGEVIFMLSSKGQLTRSGDGGKSWADQMQRF